MILRIFFVTCMVFLLWLGICTGHRNPKPQPYKIAVPPGDLVRDNFPGCDMCLWMVEQTEKYWGLNNTQQEITTLLTPFCEIIYPIQEYCVHMIQEGVGKIISYIQKELPPEWVCIQVLSACPANVTLELHVHQQENTSGTKEKPFLGREIFLQLECITVPSVECSQPYWYVWLEVGGFCGTQAHFSDPSSFQTKLTIPKPVKDEPVEIHITAGVIAQTASYQIKSSVWAATTEPGICPDSETKTA